MLLPDEIAVVRDAAPEREVIDIDLLDFYTDRKYLAVIMRRDDGACFYCGRAVTDKTAALDHVLSQMDGGDNSHRNVVTACHGCNSLKQSESAEDFLRRLYRTNVLSQSDLAMRMERLQSLRDGKIALIIDGVV